MGCRSDAHCNDHAGDEDRLEATITGILDGRWSWPIIIFSAVSLIAVALFVLFLAVFAGVAFADNQRVKKAVTSCERKAIDQSKYPSSAKIVSTDVGELTTLHNGNKTLPVEGEIDMPNAFGTPVRHTYRCDLITILEGGTLINDEPLILPKN